MQFEKDVYLEDTYFDTEPSSLPKNQVLKLRLEVDKNTQDQKREVFVKEKVSNPSLSILEKLDQAHSDEIQTRKEIGFHVDSSESVRRFLVALNFKPVVVVQKNRKYYRDPTRKLTVCLDEGPLGAFVEIEQIRNTPHHPSANIKKVTNVIFKDLEFKIEKRTYLELALDKMKKSQ